MNTQLATRPGRQAHPPQPGRTLEAQSVRRVGPIDRAAMHLGVALIKWSRRPLKATTLRELSAGNASTDEARRTIERERDQIQALYLTRLR